MWNLLSGVVAFSGTNWKGGSARGRRWASENRTLYERNTSQNAILRRVQTQDGYLFQGAVTTCKSLNLTTVAGSMVVFILEIPHIETRLD